MKPTHCPWCNLLLLPAQMPKAITCDQKNHIFFLDLQNDNWFIGHYPSYFIYVPSYLGIYKYGNLKKKIISFNKELDYNEATLALKKIIKIKSFI